MSIVSRDESAYGVVIVGAGPAGLTAANLLGRAGVETLVLERNPGLSGIPKALMVDDEFFRLLHTIGLGDALRAHGVYPISFEWYSPLGFRVAFNNGRITDHNFPNRTATFQPIFERILFDGAIAHPSVTARFGEAVVGIEGNASGVDVRVRDTDGREKMYRAAYVLGADGARSTVRELLGIPFEELFQLDERHIVVDVADDPNTSKTADLRVGWNRRHASSLPAPGGRRYEFSFRDGETDEEMSSDEALTRLFKLHGRDFRELKIIRRAVYSFRSRLVKEFRRDRVFLLGDAAHTMPVTGSQGMNSGARDAANLAWKLALVLRGAARPELLDTYHIERYDQVAGTIRVATIQTKLRNARNPVATFFRDLGLGFVLLIPWWRRYVAEMRYIPKPFLRSGVVVGSGGGDSFAGRVLTNPTVNAGGNDVYLDDVLGAGWALLGIDTAADEDVSGHPLWSQLGARTVVIRRVAAARDAVTPVPGERRFDEVFAAHAGRWLVVRPDRIVAAVAPATDLSAIAAQLQSLIASSHDAVLTSP